MTNGMTLRQGAVESGNDVLGTRVPFHREATDKLGNGEGGRVKWEDEREKKSNNKHK